MKTRLALAAVLFILSATCTDAQTLGIFSSPKGFGVTSLLNAGSRSDAFDCLTIYADIYGLPMDRADYPGIKICYSRCNVVGAFDNRYSQHLLYVGPGISTGFVHDYDRSVSSLVKLNNNPGVCLTLTCRFGLLIQVPDKGINIDFSAQLEAGMHLRDDEILKQKDLTWYKNGLYLALYPQISISFDL